MNFRSDQQRKAVMASIKNRNPQLPMRDKCQQITPLDTSSPEYRDFVLSEVRDKWVVLDPRFPNIKGVTPEEIDEFVYHYAPQIINYNKHKNVLGKLHQYMGGQSGHGFWDGKKFFGAYNVIDYLEGLSEAEKQSLTYDKLYDHFIGSKAFPNYDAYALCQQHNLLNPEEYDEEGDLIKKAQGVNENGLKEIKTVFEKLKEKRGGVSKKIDKFTLPDMELDETPEYRAEYLNHCLAYDRAEIVADCKALEKKVLSKLSKIEGHTLENLNDLENTIIVTTPRGGHELISIFAYANGIGLQSSKYVFPSNVTTDIEKYSIWHPDWYPEKETFFKKREFFGQALNKAHATTKNIQNIIYLDDISASSSQLGGVIRTLNDIFRNSSAKINFIPVFLCARPDEAKSMVDFERNKEEYDDIQKKPVKTIKLELHDVIFQHEMIDLKKFNNNFDSNTLQDSQFVSVAFPWSIPDGTSDFLLRQLYNKNLRGKTYEDYHIYITDDRNHGGLSSLYKKPKK